MKWLVILDPIDGLNPKTDTSLAIRDQAQAMGLTVDTATIEKLYYDTKSCVLAQQADGTEIATPLSEYSLIFMRKEPPYDLAFHYATQLLSLTDTLVVNAASALRDYNEKLIALPFSKFMPVTLVSSDTALLHDFLKTHSRCVIKALDSFQGQSVKALTEETGDLIETFTNNGSQPVMVQKFLDQVYEGDKRVILLGDKLLGAAVRKPKSGYHANFANSEPLATRLTPRETHIVETVGPWLVSQGIYFSGLDFIGEHLTEINITCPTGIMQISELEGRNLALETVNYFLSLIEG